MPSETDRRATEKFPPGLLAYWRGEVPTPYDDPTAWHEFAKTLTPSDDLWQVASTDTNADGDHQAPHCDEPLSDDRTG